MLAAVVIFGATGIVAGTVRVPDGKLTGAIVYIADVNAPAAPGTEVRAVIRGKQYEHRSYPIVAGTTVRWINDDPVWHNAFSVSPKATFDLGSFKTWHEKIRTFDQPGLVSVYCNMHPGEVGHFVVVPSRLYAKVGPLGEFAIVGVPPGKHTIRAWMPGVKPVEQTVEVRGDETTLMKLTLLRGRRPAYYAPFLIDQTPMGPGPTFPPRPEIP